VTTRARWLTAALPLVVVVPMLALASALGTHEIIFPEGAALAMGIWALGMPGWSASRWRVAVLPPAFALAGVLLLRLDWSLTATAILAVTLGLLALQALGTRLAPALSAAVLPIVFDVQAWGYPLAVLAVSLVVAAAMRPGPAPAERYGWRVVGGIWLVVVGWILAGGELLGLSSVALTPPLFVAALEWLGRGSLALGDGLRRWVVLVFAGLAGSVAAEVVPVAWVAGMLAVIATLAVMALLATPVPPALAIALIPLILDGSDPLSFTLAIAAGTAALYAGVYCVRERSGGRKLVGCRMASTRS
jgi:HPP family